LPPGYLARSIRKTTPPAPGATRRHDAFPVQIAASVFWLEHGLQPPVPHGFFQGSKIGLPRAEQQFPVLVLDPDGAGTFMPAGLMVRVVSRPGARRYATRTRPASRRAVSSTSTSWAATPSQLRRWVLSGSCEALALTTRTRSSARGRRSHRANSRAAPNMARGGQAKEVPGLAEPQTG